MEVESHRGWQLGLQCPKMAGRTRSDVQPVRHTAAGRVRQNCLDSGQDIAAAAAEKSCCSRHSKDLGFHTHQNLSAGPGKLAWLVMKIGPAEVCWPAGAGKRAWQTDLEMQPAMHMPLPEPDIASHSRVWEFALYLRDVCQMNAKQTA